MVNTVIMLCLLVDPSMSTFVGNVSINIVDSVMSEVQSVFTGAINLTAYFFHTRI